MLIYCFDETTKEFAYTDVIDDGAQVPENATTIAPVNADGTGMYAPTWNGTNWVSMSQEEFQEKYEQQQKPDDVPDVTQKDEQNAQQMLTLAKLQADVDALKKEREQSALLLATLMKQQATNAKEAN
ncbi:hypothetical protein E5340_06780 [Ligilactobacillus murinus]|uniref:Uncharacterized protein n=1 Tax=Ligilactobacillus murinus TaxID=1622 RepID=A0A4S2ELI1_9LACO|nr:hypothetical protein [Ligilactobacillus murinus]TGY54881.1 hypothetical protein E5340_06780 [Ligilactobacillus murinus]